jgi:hypothetical protein
LSLCWNVKASRTFFLSKSKNKCIFRACNLQCNLSFCLTYTSVFSKLERAFNLFCIVTTHHHLKCIDWSQAIIFNTLSAVVCPSYLIFLYFYFSFRPFRTYVLSSRFPITFSSLFPSPSNLFPFFLPKSYLMQMTSKNSSWGFQSSSRNFWSLNTFLSQKSF